MVLDTHSPTICHLGTPQWRASSLPGGQDGDAGSRSCHYRGIVYPYFPVLLYLDGSDRLVHSLYLSFVFYASLVSMTLPWCSDIYCRLFSLWASPLVILFFSFFMLHAAACSTSLLCVVNCL